MDQLADLALELNTAIIIVSGEPWRVHDFNQKAVDWFGHRLTRGTVVSALIPSINENALKRRLKKGRTADFDFEVDIDRPIPVEFSCSKTDVLEDGVILEGVDQTRAQSAELMLASYSRMIEEKTKELEAAIQARDQFFSTMSHELRTPLNSIIGFSESLIDEVYGELDDEQQSILKKVFMSGKNLMSLLTNLLYLSRIRSGKIMLSLKKIDLTLLCQRAIESMDEYIKEKGMQVKFISKQEGLCLPQVDEEWGQQMIEHLLNNAIKFSDEKSEIILTVSQSTYGVRVTISDQGIGIAKDRQSYIFQPFTQVDTSLARSYQGSGLGLSVVYEVIQLHGGRVSVESILGQGSHFHLDFNCDAPLSTKDFD